MPVATYDEVHKDKIEYTIQTRFAKEIRQLRAFGFNEEFYIRETGYPLSLLDLFPYLFRAYFQGNATFRIDGFLRIVSFNPYLIHDDGYAYSVVGNLRIKYATIFDDGTLLHTITGEAFKHKNVSERGYLFQMPHPGDAAQSWHAHAQKVEGLVNEGRSVISPLRVSDVMRMEMRSDAILSGERPEDWDEISMKKNKL